ncbi:cupin domain-containing protein [Aquabacterium sp.]|uniref:cupin domain-containing protein n=1 Tax=Aquabacterium sp. TaxID=1872578 RepID=UPI002CBF7652|nr:cupin domain-containing protein [Aquabacterium sp.]HSW05514.1 cupin domain-containing protein [Aquabacterium sp.]
MNKATAIPRLDNERVVVTEWCFEPGAETGHHVHMMDYLVIPLTDGTLDVGGIQTTLHTGVAYARPAGVAHNVINAGQQALRFIEVELKSPAFPSTPRGVSS